MLFSSIFQLQKYCKLGIVQNNAAKMPGQDFEMLKYNRRSGNAKRRSSFAPQSLTNLQHFGNGTQIKRCWFVRLCFLWTDWIYSARCTETWTKYFVAAEVWCKIERSLWNCDNFQRCVVCFCLCSCACLTCLCYAGCVPDAKDTQTQSNSNLTERQVFIRSVCWFVLCADSSFDAQRGFELKRDAADKPSSLACSPIEEIVIDLDIDAFGAFVDLLYNVADHSQLPFDWPLAIDSPLVRSPFNL